jgi:phosphoglycerate kinase
MGLQWVEELPEKIHIPTDYAQDALDIGPETVQTFCDFIKRAQTILWAGPMGKYEDPTYMTGSVKIAEAVVEATKNGAYSVAGGGDTVAILTELGLRDKVSFVSTGGGAMLEFLVNGSLPGIDVLG